MQDEVAVATPGAEVSDAPLVESPSSTGDNGSYQSDEQILGIQTEDAPVLQGTTETETDAPKPGEIQADDYSWATKLYKDPAYGPKLQSVIDRIKAFESLGTVADARKIRELVPEGIQRIEELVQKSQEADEMDFKFASGDPAQLEEAAQSMYELSPESAVSAVPVMLDIIKQRNPEAYQSTVDSIISNALGQEKFGEHIEAMARLLDNPQGLKDYATRLTNWARQKGYAGDKQQRLDPREEKLNQREQQFQAEQAKDFQERTNISVTAYANSQIEAFLKNLPATVSPGARARIAKDIFDGVSERLTQNKALTLEFSKGLKARNTKSVVDAYSATVRQLIPLVGKKVVEDWTGDVLSTQKARTDKINTAATRKDVAGTGNGVRAPGGPIRPSQVDYSNTSDEDILGDKVALKKR